MRERELGRFDYFVRRHGHAFFGKRHVVSKVKTNGVVAAELAGVPIHQDENSLPKGFIRLEVDEADYLFMLAATAKKGILELGRCHGGSTYLLSHANPNIPIWSIDLAPRDDALARSYLEKNELGKNTKFLLGDTQRGDWPEVGDFDLLFVDADHSYAGCLADLEQWWPRLLPGGHAALHDALHKSTVTDAIIDFLDRHADAEAIRGPYMPSGSWRNWGGAIAHLHKKK